MNHLRTILPCLLLSACAEASAPPYVVVFDESVPVTDRALWNDAVDRWNAVVGREVLRVGPPDGECGRVIVRRGDGYGTAVTFPGECNKVVEYSAPYADVCVFMHEAGHALGHDGYGPEHPAAWRAWSAMDGHEPEPVSIMRDCNGELQDLTELDGAAVRALWGLGG